MTKSKYNVYPSFGKRQLQNLDTDEELIWREACARIDNANLQRMLDHLGLSNEDPDCWEKLCMRIAEQNAKNLQKLHEKFCISSDVPGHWKRLAAALTRDPVHVTAREYPFLEKLPLCPRPKKVKTKTGNMPGAPPKMSDFELGLLVRTVDEYKRIHGLKTDKEALEKMFDDRVNAVECNNGLTKKDRVKLEEILDADLSENEKAALEQALDEQTESSERNKKKKREALEKIKVAKKGIIKTRQNRLARLRSNPNN